LKSVAPRARAAQIARLATPLDVRWLVAGVGVCLGLALTGLLIAWSSQSVRRLHVEIEANQRAQDAMLAEYSRLLIERSMVGSFQNVDQVAERQLSMTFPETVERVQP
jgi:cell division protein FtsL